MIEKPSESEYAPFYAGYIAKVPAAGVLEILERQSSELRQLAAATTPEREVFRYAPGKWSVREVLGHLIDGERIFGYRAFRIGRGDRTPLPGFDENEYVAASGYNNRDLASLVDEFALVRGGNLAVLHAFSEEDWRRLGTANGQPVSVRALAFIMAGHVNHHLALLSERYGLGTVTSPA
ncbi:MAG TPA: DinB family protein [Thermoanaerobaculia bacterium]